MLVFQNVSPVSSNNFVSFWKKQSQSFLENIIIDYLVYPKEATLGHSNLFSLSFNLMRNSIKLTMCFGYFSGAWPTWLTSTSVATRWPLSQVRLWLTASTWCASHWGKNWKRITILSRDLNSIYFWKWTNDNPMKIFRQLGSHPKLLIGSKLSLG